MKTTFRFITALLVGASLLACEKDNFAEPNASLTGRLVYQGEPIYVEYDRVNYELYQDGFGKIGPIGSTFTQEGEFSQRVFDGEYKMIIPIGQGPFVPLKNASDAADTILINVRGDQNLDVEVTPYWLIRNTVLTAGEAKDSISGTFSLAQIASGDNARDIENVTLFVGRTAFANPQSNIARVGINGSDITDTGSVSLTVAVPDLKRTQDYLFASIGLKIAGVEDMIFSATQRIEL